jgi:hypothetical protein
VRFDENDGSRVEQSGVCDVGDEIPPHAIRRMGVGHLIPIEEPLLAEGEGQCSTQVEPSLSQPQKAPQGPIDANQRKIQDPQPNEHDQDQDQEDSGEPSPMVDQGQAQDDEQAHYDGQDEDQNGGDDQVTSQESLEEADSHRKRMIETKLKNHGVELQNILGSLDSKVVTRRQLANFSKHHAFVSCVEPKKVFEALEDADWLKGLFVSALPSFPLEKATLTKQRAGFGHRLCQSQSRNYTVRAKHGARCFLQLRHLKTNRYIGLPLTLAIFT